MTRHHTMTPWHHDTMTHDTWHMTPWHHDTMTPWQHNDMTWHDTTRYKMTDQIDRLIFLFNFQFQNRQCQSIPVSQWSPVSQFPSIPISQHPNIPISQYPSIPISQYPSIPVSQYPSIPVSQYPSIPVSRWSPVSQYPPVSQHPSIPISQYPNIPIYQYPSIPASQYPSIPVSRLEICCTLVWGDETIADSAVHEEQLADHEVVDCDEVLKDAEVIEEVVVDQLVLASSVGVQTAYNTTWISEALGSCSLRSRFHTLDNWTRLEEE